VHAYLITGPQAVNQIDTHIQKIGVIAIEFEIQKVEDVKPLREFLSLSQPRKTAIIIKNIHQASVEAQNALLKALEEPQENIVFLLTAITEETVLPTILSRVEIITVQSAQASDTNQTASKFLQGSTAEKLAITSKIKTREDAIDFISGVIETTKDIALLESATAAYSALAANGNIQLHLTNFVIKIDERH
jgi:DNA polymerase III delta prime subunit